MAIRSMSGDGGLLKPVGYQKEPDRVGKPPSAPLFAVEPLAAAVVVTAETEVAQQPPVKIDKAASKKSDVEDQKAEKRRQYNRTRNANRVNSKSPSSNRERRELLIEPEQNDFLKTEAIRLKRANGNTAPSVTANDLARIALDLLISQKDKLSGGTEEELRKSLGL
jgi:hypothetical protein